MSRLFADGSTSRESGRELGESRLHTTWVDLTPAPSTEISVFPGNQEPRTKIPRKDFSRNLGSWFLVPGKY